MAGKNLRGILEELDFWLIPTSFFRHEDFRKELELKAGKISTYVSLGISEGIRIWAYTDLVKYLVDYF